MNFTSVYFTDYCHRYDIRGEPKEYADRVREIIGFMKESPRGTHYSVLDYPDVWFEVRRPRPYDDHIFRPHDRWRFRDPYVTTFYGTSDSLVADTVYRIIRKNERDPEEVWDFDHLSEEEYAQKYGHVQIYYPDILSALEAHPSSVPIFIAYTCGDRIFVEADDRTFCVSDFKLSTESPS